ncbi:hypothetical protein ACBT_0178 [Aliarcobacter cibarius]|uniref:Uncharacterized protein n=1 Tax=Aliarcobacter cibarius TaxID=255507 RepID=A0A7L5JLX2_9BACT|nr:hypothetical protein [Aliarcobacter cibarius]QKJ26162.1 hypothetical protein ACBT_0178 [Aliarcobacter cibarius]
MNTENYEKTKEAIIYQNKKFSNVVDDNFNKLNSLNLYKDKVAFEFKDGWTDLIYNLGKDIEELCKLTNCELPKIQQIKEKFGTLRFYYNTLNSQYPEIVEKSIRALVFQAEIKSSNTYEVCGKYGETRVENRIYTTVCEEHKGNSISKNEYEEMVKNHHEKRALEKVKKCN